MSVIILILLISFTIYAKCSMDMDLSPQMQDPSTSAKLNQREMRIRKVHPTKKIVRNENRKFASANTVRARARARIHAGHGETLKPRCRCCCGVSSFARVHILIECNLSQWQIIRTDGERTDITMLFTRAFSNRIALFRFKYGWPTVGDQRPSALAY